MGILSHELCFRRNEFPVLVDCYVMSGAIRRTLGAMRGSEHLRNTLLSLCRALETNWRTKEFGEDCLFTSGPTALQAQDKENTEDGAPHDIPNSYVAWSAKRVPMPTASSGRSCRTPPP